MGCGRVGALLATRLDEAGHSVGVIDQDPDAFRRLPDTFSGRRITGMGFDRDSLIQAGIEDAFALAAVSSGDNSNIITARVARETFGVQRVVARIYDPQRASAYQHLGITTVATVRWTTEQFLRRLIPRGTKVEYRDASGQVSLALAEYSPSWVGKSLRDLTDSTGVRVAYITRDGTSFLPEPTTVLQELDMLFILAPTDSIEKAQRALLTTASEE